MAVVDFNIPDSTYVTNPDLTLVNDKHLETKRHEGSTTQAMHSIDEKKTKRTKLLPTSKTAPTLTNSKESNFQALVVMMIAILAMESLLQKNMGQKQIYQSKIGNAFVRHAISEEKYVQKELKKIAAERRKAEHQSFWHKAFGWALTAVGAALAVLTAGVGAALVLATLTVLSQTGEMDKGFMGKLNKTLLGKIAVVLVLSLLAGGVAGGLNAAAEGTAVDFTEGAAQEGFNSYAAIGTAAMEGVNNNLVGTMIYDCLPSKYKTKEAKEICKIVGMIVTLIAAIAAAKGCSSVEAPSSQTVQKTVKALNVLALTTAIGTGTFQIMAGVTQYQTAEEMDKYAKHLGSYTLFKELADISNQRAKESQDDVKRQMNTFDSLNQTFTTITLPYRAIAQVLA